MSRCVSIIIPAHNEARYIETCLLGLLSSEGPHGNVEIIVVANGCADDTADKAKLMEPDFVARGWVLQVIETPIGNKPHALNIGDAEAAWENRVYLDADVTVSRDLISQIVQRMDRHEPIYVSGTPVVTAPRYGISRPYARFWAGLPFVAEGVPGFGIFAVNKGGRARWREFPEVISDDTFVRLNFAPHERVRVAASYNWPIVDGFRKLVRVRRRQDIGVHEISAKFPRLGKNSTSTKLGLSGILTRLVGDPVGFFAYGFVSLAVRLPILKSDSGWARGR